MYIVFQICVDIYMYVDICIYIYIYIYVYAINSCYGLYLAELLLLGRDTHGKGKVYVFVHSCGVHVYACIL